MSLVTLVIFFKDSLIEWWEAAMLLAIYFAYVGFMKINPQAERFVKKLLYKNKVTRVRSTDHLVPTVSENSMKIMQSISFSFKKYHPSCPTYTLPQPRESQIQQENRKPKSSR